MRVLDGAREKKRVLQIIAMQNIGDRYKTGKYFGHFPFPQHEVSETMYVAVIRVQWRQFLL